MRWIVVLLVFIFSFYPGLCLRKFYMEDECSGRIDMENLAIPAGRLQVTRRSKYRNALSCAVTIVAPVDKRIVIVFRKMDIEWEQYCDDDYVSIHDGPSIMSSVVEGTQTRMCGHKIPGGSFTSIGHVITVFFQSDIYKQDNGFEIVFTAFHKSPSCFLDELRCRNGRCIAKVLECNKFDNCGDNSDECKLETEVIVGIVLSVFLLTVISVGIFYIAKGKRREKNAKKLLELKSSLKKVTRYKPSCTNIEIHPCEVCAMKIIEAERAKQVHGSHKVQEGLDNPAMIEDLGVKFSLPSASDSFQRNAEIGFRNSI